MAFNIVAASCRTLSLGHILINYVFSAVITIAHGDPGGDDKDNRGGVHHVAYPCGYYAASLPPPAAPLMGGFPST